MKMKRYIKPEMKEHIPLTPFVCQTTGISGTGDDEKKEEGSVWDPVKRRSGAFDDAPIEEDGTFFQSIYEPCH